MKRFYLASTSLLLLLFFLALFFRPITSINFDLGREILLGRIIVQEHRIPYTNLLSFTYPNYPYQATSWLSEVVYYKITNIAGFNLLLLLSTGIVLAACLLQLKFVLPKYSRVSVFAVSFFYLLLLGMRTDLRPEFFSMLFMSLFIYILRSHKNLTLPVILPLIMIEILWVNMHIYFIVGPLLVVLFLLDRLIVHKRISAKEILTLTGVSGATLINPDGLRGALYPFVVFQNYGFPVTENQNILEMIEMFGTTYSLPVLAILILFTLLVVGRKNTKPIDWLLSFVFSFLFLLNFRNIILFIFATFIPLVSQLSFIIRKYSRKIASIPHPLLIFPYLLSASLLMVVIITLMLTSGLGFGIRDYGKKSVDFILKNKIDGPLYNDFNIGGYLTYRLYPRLVFLDNRPEAYPASFFRNTYLPMRNNPEIFTQLDSKYRFNGLIVSLRGEAAWRNTLLHYFIQNKKYSLVYLDSYAFVMVRNSAENRELVKKFEISPNSFRFPDELDSGDLISYLIFFERIGWNDKAKEAFSGLMKKNPEFCSPGNLTLLRQAKIDYCAKN
jgi:hypothetical protein